MSMLKQKELIESLIQIVQIRYRIDDGYHNKELAELIKVGNVLYEELNDINKGKFQLWLKKKMEEHENEGLEA